MDPNLQELIREIELDPRPAALPGSGPIMLEEEYQKETNEWVYALYPQGYSKTDFYVLFYPERKAMNRIAESLNEMFDLDLDRWKWASSTEWTKLN